MDRIRTLLLARTHVVVMDPDLVASASTRPTRDSDLDKLEDELAQLGFVMSLDLAITLRRLPFQTMQELRGWMFETLAREVGAARPHVPLYRAFAAGGPAEARAPYLRRMLTWLATRAEQPCPWCGEHKALAALDPCGHAVCKTCWDGTGYSGCPICHRRIALGDPFLRPSSTVPAAERVQRHEGTLTLIHLAFDWQAVARARFARLVSRVTPLSPGDRTELETWIDTIGPQIASWLPARILVRETLALVLARLWLIAPDRAAMARDTAARLESATDVLRVAVVVMGGNPALVEPIRLGAISRGLRRVLLAALDRMPLDQIAEAMARHPSLWKRVGERLHPFEQATRFPNAALAFAIVRGTDLDAATFGPALRERATIPSLKRTGNRIRVVKWAGPVEDALRANNPRSALARLTHRPSELLRRADHLVRLAQTRQVDALTTILKAVQLSAARGSPATLFTLASHVARRGRPWHRRVFVPKGDVLRAWALADRRPPLRGDAMGSMISSLRVQLVHRAEALRQFPRAVIDRALLDVLVPTSTRTAAPTRLTWSRGSELNLPAGQTLRLFLHWEEPAGREVDLDLSIAAFDITWRHVATCDFTNLVVGDRAAVHSGDATSAPAPFGASELVDLHLEKMHDLGAAFLVMTVFSYNAVPFESLPYAFAGLVVAPPDGTDAQPFDPRAVVQRFDLRGRSLITVPLMIDIGARRLRWLDVHIKDKLQLQQAGGYRAALAHVGRDLSDFVMTESRPTLWDVAAVHAAARANMIYVRERDGSFTAYRRRDHESTVHRLARLLSGVNHDGTFAQIPAADAPTWFALTAALSVPSGSVGYVLDPRGLGPGVQRLSAAELVAELVPLS